MAIPCMWSQFDGRQNTGKREECPLCRILFRALPWAWPMVAPIGVQNLFVIHSALAHPRRRALATAGIVIFFDVTLALACFLE